jgi:hypothetical protein
VRTGRLIAAVAVAAATAFVAPLAHGDDTTLSIADATATDPAARGAAMQVTETLPPPRWSPTGPGDDVEIPANSGTGRRVVYSKGIMRVWLIEEDGTVHHTHRVSGLESQPSYGTYSVFSRSEWTCSRNSSSICMRWMVRFTKSRRGDNIGFHEIPRRNGVPMQDISELGLALSSGCVRQATDDAIVMWNWAQLGTVVVVVP